MVYIIEDLYSFDDHRQLAAAFAAAQSFVAGCLGITVPCRICVDFELRREGGRYWTPYRLAPGPETSLVVMVAGYVGEVMFVSNNQTPINWDTIGPLLSPRERAAAELDLQATMAAIAEAHQILRSDQPTLALIRMAAHQGGDLPASYVKQKVRKTLKEIAKRKAGASARNARVACDKNGQSLVSEVSHSPEVTTSARSTAKGGAYRNGEP